MSPARELADYLVDLGVAVAFGGGEAGSVHVSREPASPPEVITLYDTGGVEHIPDIELSTVTVQARVRHTAYEDGYALQEQIRDAFLKPRAIVDGNPAHFDAGGSRYIAATLRGAILPLGRDDNDLFLFTANYELQRQPLETS